MSARDRQIVALERQLKQAIRDAVNRPSRKPFAWGGLTGYRQLSAIADGIRQLVDETSESHYLRRLLSQVDRALETYRALAQDLEAAHNWLRCIAAVLHYRLSTEEAWPESLTSESVAQSMQQLLAAFRPDCRRQPAQCALHSALFRAWRAFGRDLLHCYDIQGLPPDNLALEARFSALRRHQRRISGHKATRELRVLGHYQVLFQAKNQKELLAGLRQVPLEHYRHHRRLLHQAGDSERFLHRLHRDPSTTIQSLVDAYKTQRLQALQYRNPPTNQPENTS